MPNTLKIILGELGKTNYQPQIFLLPVDEETGSPLPTQYISWCWISADELIAPGIYDIPEDQRNNLAWFSDNKFRLDDYGKRHVGHTMTDYLPESVTVI